MKKLIALLLAVVMCLSLCACGSSEAKEETQINNPITSESQSIIENYEAIGSTTENTVIDHPLLPYLYGQWEMKGENIQMPNPFSLLIINEDGTCIADGRECTWTVFDASTKDLFIDILYDSVKIGGLVLWDNNDDGTLDAFGAMGEMDYTFCMSPLEYIPISDETSK